MSLFESLFGKPDMDPIFDGMSEADRKQEKRRTEFLSQAANRYKAQSEKAFKENARASEADRLETSVNWLSNYLLWQIFAEAARNRPPSGTMALEPALRATALQCMPLKRDSKTIQKLVALPEIRRLFPELSEELFWNAIETARDHERRRIDSVKRAIISGPAYLAIEGKPLHVYGSPKSYGSVNAAWFTGDISLSNSAWKTVECFVEDIDGNRILIFSYFMDPDGRRNMKKDDLWTPP